MKEYFSASNCIPRHFVLFLALGAMLLVISSTQAQQPAKKVPRIGFLGASSASFYSARIETFRQGLRELGYVEDKNIAIEYRFADGKNDQLPEIAAEVVRLKVDVIVTTPGGSALALKSATKTIPIVFVAVGDPVGIGLADSLARPGGNLTGLTILAQELSGKRLELLKETSPRITRVALLFNPSSVDRSILLKETETAAQRLRLRIQSLEVRSPTDFDGAFAAAIKERAHALITAPHPIINTHRARVLEFVSKNRLPAIFTNPETVEAGGLMSYSADFAEQFRRAAVYVDKILKGAKPADLPVEQPMKFELVVNLKTAKEIGLTIPPNLLARANRVIK
jgi:putative tryptophan/tyrosine transport system substrate-binding protein